MSFRFTFSLFLTSIFSSVASQAAETPSFSVTDTFLSAYWADNQNGRNDDDNFGLLVNRLNISAHTEHILAQVRVDGMTFFASPSPWFKDNLRLQRIRLGLNYGAWKIDVGDFYKQLGRGIVLSLRKGDELGRDIALRGGQVQFNNSRHTVSLFAGVSNSVNLDAITFRALATPMDILAGLEHQWRSKTGLSASVYGLYLQPQDALAPELVATDRSYSGGTAIEWADLTDWLSVSLEADAQYRLAIGQGKMGYAGYFISDLFFADTSMQLQALYLNDFIMRGSPRGEPQSGLGDRYIYNRPPSLERLQDEIINSENVFGIHLHAEHYIDSLEQTYFINGVYRLEDPQSAAISVWHAFGGTEIFFQERTSRLQVTGGYRIYGDIDSNAHTELDYLQSLGGRYAAHFLSNTELHWTPPKNDSSTLSFWRGDASIGIERAGLGSLSFEFGFDTQNQSPGVATLFYAGTAAIEIHRLVKAMVVVGTQRGGIKCSGGLCRVYPPFSGARAEIVARY